ncbi:hypothetical protein BC938DRAFT_474527 [Jimgerdemannia flammicorona]|uniref:Uncharacterized protein n=1 Tax=Jimgerdemannia flammicorona TaxID=994334 RepID=A0A433Q205_9FUNG|nr:hypothetical protein BC938DRAFT_474527 [Jimgerdemannia flammicorona]
MSNTSYSMKQTNKQNAAVLVTTRMGFDDPESLPLPVSSRRALWNAAESFSLSFLDFFFFLWVKRCANGTSEFVAKCENWWRAGPRRTS